jgi:hypothetical protein
VIDGPGVLERGERFRLPDRDATLGSEDPLGDGAVHQPAADGAAGELRRLEVDVPREHGADLGEHRVSPRVAAEEPVAIAGREAAVAGVARHAFIEVALGHEGHDEVVGAPDKGDADAVRVGLARSDAPLDPLAVVPREDSLEVRFHEVVQPEVAGVLERVELVMPGLVAAHPPLVGREPGVMLRLVEIPPLARGPEQLGGATLHVVGPGRLLVAIGGLHRVALLRSFAGEAEFVDLPAGLQATLREAALGRIVLPDLMGQGHRGGEPAGDVRHAGRLALVRPQSLRRPVREVDHPRAALPPPVIRGLVLGEAEADVVAVVGDLMVELSRGRMELEHPFEAPARLVEDVGPPIRSGVARGVDAVCKPVAPGTSQRIREQHLGRGVARGHVILEQVARVVPPADGVDDASRRPRAVGRPPVALVAFHAEPGVVAATLLAHELEHLVGQLGQRAIADDERQRLRLADPHDVAPGPVERREVQLGVVLERAPSLARQRPRLSSEGRRPGLHVDDGELGRHGRPRERHRDLRVSQAIADLIGPEEDLLRSERRRGDEP